MESNVVVWHTTEGTSLPSYSGGAEAPNFTAVPDFKAKKLKWYQHFDFDTSARALMNRSGGVETNTANAVQIELVGTCDPSAHKRWKSEHLYTADLPDWVIRDLAAFAKWANKNHGVKLESGVKFKAYPSSYGSNGVRLTGAQWGKFYGHLGHQHVPENDHGDPGAFPIEKILAAAKGTVTKTPAPAPAPKTNTPSTSEATAVTTLESVSLGRTGTKTLTDTAWYQIYWDAEYRDADDNHGAGGKTVAIGALEYQALVHLTLDDALVGSTVQVRAVEEDSTGARVKEWHITEAQGTAGKTFITVPFLNYLGTGRRLSFEVAYFGVNGESAVMSRCEVQAHIWRS
jgi:hypothetical protein